jgi:hypothetical protein
MYITLRVCSITSYSCAVLLLVTISHFRKSEIEYSTEMRDGTRYVLFLVVIL